MIIPAYIRTMAAYNAEMNRRLFGLPAAPGRRTSAGTRGVLGLDPRHPDLHLVGRPAVDVAFRRLAEAEYSNQAKCRHDRRFRRAPCGARKGRCRCLALG